MKLSVIIPARDEEKYIGKCLDSIRRATKPQGLDVEVIVVLNRCADSTEQIAREWGARIVNEDAKNLARIRNRGAAAASGDIIVTIDADSWMSENMLTEIVRALDSRRHIGGGVRVIPERLSPGIRATMLFLEVTMFLTGLAGGLYWCRREDFEAVGGFNEDLAVAEDLDFAKRLRGYGKSRGLKFTTLRKAYIVTSCRKFDRFGDWIVFKIMLFDGKEVMQGLRGKNQSFANRYFYDFKR